VEAAVGAVSFDAKWVANEETTGDREDVGASLCTKYRGAVVMALGRGSRRRLCRHLRGRRCVRRLNGRRRDRFRSRACAMMSKDFHLRR